jgi:hypothetical protein
VTTTHRLQADIPRLAIFLALFLGLHAGLPNPTQVAVSIAFAVVLAISIRWPIQLLALAALVVAAVVLRLSWLDNIGSDVLRVTSVAIDRALAGLSPYGYAYQSSSPPGAPFPYGPLAILLYIPFHHVEFVLELLSGLGVVAILAFQGRLIGLAVYAAAPIIVRAATDGSNDTTLGLLILLTFVTAKRWPLGAAFLLACAAGFKISALAFAPGFFLWAGLRATLMFLAGSVMVWSPLPANWGISAFLDSLSRANNVHTASVWSLGVIVRELLHRRPDALDQLRYGFGAAIALVGVRSHRSLDQVLVIGTAAYLVTLYGGNWASSAYLAGIAPILCWRLDDWLGIESQPLAGRLRALRDDWRRRRGASAEMSASAATAPTAPAA